MHRDRGRRRIISTAEPDGWRRGSDARAETLPALLTEGQVGGVVATARRAGHDVVLERALTLRRMGQYGRLTVKQASSRSLLSGAGLRGSLLGGERGIALLEDQIEA